MTSDHSLDHVYTLPLMATAGNKLLFLSYEPHNAIFSLRILVSLSVHGRVISLVAKERKI